MTASTILSALTLGTVVVGGLCAYYLSSVPVEASFVLLHGYLDYPDGGHSAEVLAAVPPTESPPTRNRTRDDASRGVLRCFMPEASE